MHTTYTKEDLGLAKDVEVFENEVNMFDSPLDVLMECFPNEENYLKRLHEFYIDYAKPYLNSPKSFSIKEIVDRVSKKARKSTLEIDIEIKAIIEQTFIAELEEKTELSETIISSLPKELWLNKTVVASALQEVEEISYIKERPEELRDKTLYNNKLIKGHK